MTSMDPRPNPALRRAVQVVSLPALVAVLLAGCGAGGSTPVATASADVTESAGSSPRSTASGSALPGPSGTSMAQPPAATATAQVVGSAAPEPSGELKAAVVREIRTADQGSFDRVVIEFEGTFGPYQVGYVPAVTEDPTDEPVALQGAAFLRVVVQNATFDNVFQAEGSVPHLAYTGPRRLTAALPVVQEVADAGDFEAVISLGIGLSRQAGLRVSRLEGPSRLVIDVAH